MDERINEFIHLGKCFFHVPFGIVQETQHIIVDDKLVEADLYVIEREINKTNRKRMDQVAIRKEELFDQTLIGQIQANQYEFILTIINTL